MIVVVVLCFFTYLRAQCVTDEQCNEIRLNAEYWKPAAGDAYNDADLIVDGLYLGNVCAAHSTQWLTEHNVTLIVSVAREWSTLCRGVRTLAYDIDDSNGENATRVAEYFQEVATLIATHLAARSNGNVLVHCNMGISRSTSAVLAYLRVRSPHKSYRRLLNLVRARRPVAKPNDLFGTILAHDEL